MPALLKIKNEIIYQLHQEETGIQQNAITNFNEMASKELESWSNYLSQTQADVKQFQLICYFCAETLNDNSINGQCYLNKKKMHDKEKKDKGFNGFTKKHPKDKFYGNNQHFFAEPLQNIFTDGIAFNNLQALFSEDQKDRLKKGLVRQLQLNLTKINKLCREKNLNLRSKFLAHDEQGVGMVTKAQFYFILSFLAGFEAEKIKDFEQLLDGHGKGIINYAKFLALLDDPNEILHLEKKESYSEKDSDNESGKKSKKVKKDKVKHERPEKDGSQRIDIEPQQDNGKHEKREKDPSERIHIEVQRPNSAQKSQGYTGQPMGQGYTGQPIHVQPNSQMSEDKYPMRDFSNLSGRNSQSGMYGVEVPGLLTTQDANTHNDPQASTLAWDKVGYS